MMDGGLKIHNTLSISGINANHGADDSRRQVKNLTNVVKNIKIMEIHDHIWNHNEKCI